MSQSEVFFEKLSIFRKNWIDTFPGFWLNFLGLSVCLGVVLLQSFSEERKLDRIYLAARETTVNTLSKYLAGAKDKDWAYDHLRTSFLPLLFAENPEEAQLAEAGLVTSIQDEYDTACDFLNSLRLRDLIAFANIREMEPRAEALAHRIREPIYRNSPLLRNRNLFYAWALIATIYLGIVAFAYFQSRLRPEEGEPILNIIDLGLYFALVEYSGSFTSPALPFLSFSIMVAGLDFLRIVRNTGGLSRSALQVYGVRGIIGHYAPAILYLFALSSGLVWASLDHAIANNLQVGEYALAYLLEFVFITCIGALGLAFFLLLSQLVRRNEASQSPYRYVSKIS